MARLGWLFVIALGAFALVGALAVVATHRDPSAAQKRPASRQPVLSPPPPPVTPAAVPPHLLRIGEEFTAASGINYRFDDLRVFTELGRGILAKKPSPGAAFAVALITASNHGRMTTTVPWDDFACTDVSMAHLYEPSSRALVAVSTAFDGRQGLGAQVHPGLEVPIAIPFEVPLELARRGLRFVSATAAGGVVFIQITVEPDPPPSAMRRPRPRRLPAPAPTAIDPAELRVPAVF